MMVEERRRGADPIVAPQSLVGALSERLERIVLPVSLTAVLTAGFVLALFWSTMVPIFQSPDENAHFEYAHALGSARHLLFARDALSGDDPEMTAFEIASGLPAIAFKAEQAVPERYGTPAFFAAIDRNVPPLPAGYYGSPGHLNPRLLNVYPFGFYALIGAYIAVLQYVLHAGIVEQFYGSRLICTLLFVSGTALWYKTLRAAGQPATAALGITALVALFPLSSFVASYVQPDNLAFALVPVLLFTALRTHRRMLRESVVAAYGLALGVLLVTKFQYALCVGIVTLPMIVLRLSDARLGAGRKLRHIAWLVLPAAVLFGIHKYVIAYGSEAYFTGPYALNRGLTAALASGSGIAYALTGLHKAYADYFSGGNTMVSYWGDFGWLDTPVAFGNPIHSAMVWAFIGTGTNLVILATAIGALRNVWRLSRLAVRRSWRMALALLIANPIVNAYIVFTLFMVALYVVSNNSFGAQGRNWYPFEGAAFFTLLSFAPRVLSWRRWRRTVIAVAAIFLAGYCTIGSYLCITAVERRYYHPMAPRPAIDPAHLRLTDTRTNHNVDEMRVGGVLLSPNAITRVPAGSSLFVNGWALDQLQAVNGGVYLTFDGRFWTWTARLVRADVAAAFGNSAFSASGFATTAALPAARGLHRIGIRIVSSDRSFAYQSALVYTVLIY